MVKLYEAISKAEEDNTVQELLDQLDLDWSNIVPDIEELLSATAAQGVKDAMKQIAFTEKEATKLANSRAEEWAADRAAELVGMKWIDGELVTNPNAEWSIAESTRDMIYKDVDSAISEGWSNQRLRDAIVENTGFSDSRAMMIARTETAFADTQGNKAAYLEAKDAGLDVKWQWMTAGDDLVSEECEMNDGEVREIGEEFPSGAIECPQHPNCRCVLAPAVEDDPQERQDTLSADDKQEESVSSQDNLDADSGDDTGQDSEKAGTEEIILALEADIAGNDFETAIFVDNDGAEVFRKRGEGKLVSFTREECEMATGNILTHNHPSGTAFSEADIYFLKSWEPSSLRATSTEFLYEMSLTEQGLSTSKADFESALTRSQKKIKKELTAKCNSGEITYKEADAIHAHLRATHFADMGYINYNRIEL